MTRASVIFDLDGTLCDVTHRRTHIECERPNWRASPIGLVSHFFEALRVRGKPHDPRPGT